MKYPVSVFKNELNLCVWLTYEEKKINSYFHYQLNNPLIIVSINCLVYKVSESSEKLLLKLLPVTIYSSPLKGV